MDELDKKIYELYRNVNSKIEVPNECENIIKESLNYDKIKKKTKHYSLAKIAITACASLISTAGMVYAGTAIVNKIWKQPEKVVGFYSDENTNQITDEEKASAMSEQEAREKAKELLKKFGHEGEKIKSIELENNADSYRLLWCIETSKNTTILFDARNENAFSLTFDDVIIQNIKNYRTTEKEAEKTAKNLCKKYGYDLEEYTYIRVSSNMGNEKESYIWKVDFFKQYDGIVSPYEAIHIEFIPELNEVYYFSVANTIYENNLVEITEEQAKEITLTEEEKINVKYDIKDIKMELSIVEMNGLAYSRITDYEQYCKQNDSSYPSENLVQYRTDRRIRKAWAVTINYDIPESVNRFDESFNPCLDECFTYFIDATTGEIIGGDNGYEDTKKLLYK